MSTCPLAGDATEPRPQSKGAGSHRSPFWGFLSVYAYTVYRTTTTFDVVTHGEGGLFLCVSLASFPRDRISRAPQFGVLPYLCPHPLTQNDQIRHGNTYGERTCFRRSTTPLHLHKYVARFVSDSCVSYATY